MSLSTTYLSKLTLSNVSGGNFYGNSIAISGDGNTIAAAAGYESGSLNQNSSAIRILTKSGNNWAQTASVLVPSSSNDDYFSYSVALSADGTVLVIGAIHAEYGSTVDAGRAYVYTYNGTDWDYVQTLTASDATEYSYFGTSISISADGLVIAVGSPSRDSADGVKLDTGAVYLYRKRSNAATYAFDQKITASDEGEDFLFGASVSASVDGKYVAVGAPGSGDMGAAYVFYNTSGSAWSEQQKITSVDALSGEYFGYSLSLSADSSTLAVGSSSRDPSETVDRSAVTVFTRSGSTWSRQAQLAKSDSSGSEYFGHSLSLSFDGSTMLAGVWEGLTSSISETGAAHVYRRTGSTWSLSQKITTNDANLSDRFGYSVSLSLYTGFAAIGSPYSSSSSSSNAGAIYTYSVQITDADTYSPYVLNGTITATNRQMDSISVSWPAAYDNFDPSASLSYEVRYSTSNNMSTVSDYLANGTVGAAYSVNALSATVSGLSPGTTYYIAVGAKDSAGNVSVYSTLTSSTLADTLSPTISSGTITGTASLQSIALSWTKATDNGSQQANLQYAVYRSTSNNIGTVSTAESNGTLIMSYTSNVASYNATGLTSATTYYFNVIVKDEAGNKSAYTTLTKATTSDTIAPIPGDMGTITATPASQTRIDLSWAAAADNQTSQANLQYAVYRSLFSNLTSVEDIEANGTLIADYTANLTSYSAATLTYNTMYYFNVIVKDALGNKAAYETTNAKTLADTTAPVVGTASVAEGSLVDSAYVSWTAASDNLTATANIRYAVYMSSSNNISTVSTAESNGTLVQSYQTGLGPAEVFSLTPGVTYYFAVIARDLANNKSIYPGTSYQVALDTTAPTSGSSGSISAVALSQTSIYLSWFAASDSYTAQSSLQYAIYQSSSSNIGTVADAEANGTLISSYTANRTSLTVNGLNYNTKYYFNVVVKDGAGNKTAYSTTNMTTLNDSSPPNVGFLTAYNAAMTGATVSWTAGSDDFTPSSDLQYAVYQSTANNIGSISNAENNGTLIRGYSTTRSPLAVTGLSPSTTYYFTVIVKDNAGNKSIYNVASISTLADTVPPVIGVARIDSVSYQSMVLSFDQATDSTSAQGDIQYALYRSLSGNISGVANAEANGASMRFYSTDYSPITVSNLTSNTTYYFTVIARDPAGNKSAYPMISASTLADTFAPAPGGGGFISTSTVSDSRIDLSWTAATDVGSSGAELEYAVYRSRSNNIATAATAIANGVLVQSWTPNLGNISVTGLAVATSYFFSVIVRDAAGNMSAYAVQTASTRSDILPPTVPLLGGVFVSSVTWSSLNLSWLAATDNLTPQADLLYRVYQSRSNNLSTVAQVEANGTMLVSTKNISSFSVTNLSQGTTYYYNTMVIDRFGNKSIYAPVVAKTTINDVSPIPGSGGSINAAGSLSGEIALSWVRGFDRYTQSQVGSANDSTTLQYAVYSAPYTLSPTGVRLFPSFRTVAEVEAIGTLVANYTTDMTSYTITGLDSAQAYYYNIIVKDSAGNKSTYLGTRAFTLFDSTAPVPDASGLLSFGAKTDNSIVLNWTKAIDDFTQQSRLRYEVRYSELNNIDTVWTFKNGSIALPYTADINTATVTGLKPNTTYYFNVMAMDSTGNKAVYSMVSNTTLPDTTAPLVGGGGTLSFSQIAQDQLKISWSKATDTVTPIDELQYAVYQSKSDNIPTVTTAETNGDMVVNYSANIDYALITDLDPSTTYYFTVVVKDAANNKSAYTMGNATTAQDTLAPTAGNNGAILSSNLTTTSVSLSWGKATDDYTAQSKIVYSLYRSMLNNIGTVTGVNSNGTLVTSGEDLTSYSVTGLNPASTYFFNVVAADASNNKVAYSQRAISTVIDTSAPSVGNSGIVNASLATSSSVLLSWTMGVDNVTSSDQLTYGVYKSTSDNISTVHGMEADGELVGSFMVGATTLSVKDLDASTQYYFNVMLKDSAGNKAAYVPVAATTLADTTPPVVGGEGRISFSSVTKDSMVVSWNHATDNNSFTAAIQYEVRAVDVADGDPAPNLNTVANAEANGSVVKVYSSANYGTVTGLTSNTMYYFNVIARDAAGNKVVYSQSSQRTANDLIEFASSAVEINNPVILSSNVDLIKNLPGVASDPTLSKPSNWAKVHMIYKSSITAKRVVVTITDFTNMSGQFIAKDAETFYIHKIIVEDEYGNFVSVPASSITNASNWSLTVT